MKTKEEKKEYYKEYSQKNKEKIREYYKEYSQKNKEKIKKQRKKYYLENEEKRKEYREKNKEKIKEQRRKYRKKNKEEIVRKKKEYYKKNRDRILKANAEKNLKITRIAIYTKRKADEVMQILKEKFNTNCRISEAGSLKIIHKKQPKHGRYINETTVEYKDEIYLVGKKIAIKRKYFNIYA
jgi:hypothetical protein